MHDTSLHTDLGDEDGGVGFVWSDSSRKSVRVLVLGSGDVGRAAILAGTLPSVIPTSGRTIFPRSFFSGCDPDMPRYQKPPLNTVMIID